MCITCLGLNTYWLHMFKEMKFLRVYISNTKLWSYKTNILSLSHLQKYKQTRGKPKEDFPHLQSPLKFIKKFISKPWNAQIYEKQEK